MNDKTTPTPPGDARAEPTAEDVELVSDFAREVENTMGWDAGKGTWKAREEARDALYAHLVALRRASPTPRPLPSREEAEQALGAFRLAAILARYPLPGMDPDKLYAEEKTARSSLLSLIPTEPTKENDK